RAPTENDQWEDRVPVGAPSASTSVDIPAEVPTNGPRGPAVTQALDLEDPPGPPRASSVDTQSTSYGARVGGRTRRGQRLALAILPLPVGLSVWLALGG